jgi:hypothetical protein
MFEINQDNRMSLTERLLFNILETQQAILGELRTLNTKKVELPSEVIKIPTIANIEESNGFKCKYCGESHARTIDVVNCGKKKNKKG